MLCSGEKCYWYGHEKIVNGKRVRRMCYYEPGCWRGDLDITLFTIGLLFKGRRPDSKAQRDKSEPEGK